MFWYVDLLASLTTLNLFYFSNFQTIQSIQDSSNYMCYLNNTVGNVHKMFQLIVQHAPKFDDDKLELHQSVKLHHGVNLNCKVDGHPDPKIKWIYVRSFASLSENILIRSSLERNRNFNERQRILLFQRESNHANRRY